MILEHLNNVGCETIWIVGHMGTMPLVKKRAGEFITDPIIVEDNQRYVSYKKQIPIYYVPIHPIDKNRRDCLGWSVLYGANVAYGTSKIISNWTRPDIFYCSFPYSLHNIKDIKSIRNDLLNRKKISLSYDNKTVKDNMHINFSFDKKDFINCRDKVKRRDIQGTERYKTTARNYDLETVFSPLDNNERLMLDLPWHYDASTWENYKSFLSSDKSDILKKSYYCVSREKKERYLENVEKSRRELQQDEPVS